MGMGALDWGSDVKAEGPTVFTPPVFCLCFPLTPERTTCSGTERQWAAVTGGGAEWAGGSDVPTGQQGEWQ